MEDATRFRRCPPTRRSDLGLSACSDELQISHDSLRVALRRDRRVRRRQLQRLLEELRPDHPGQQQLLRPRVLLERHQARRPVPHADRPGEAAGPPGPRAQGLRRAEGPATGGHARAGRESPRRSPCATRSTVPCRSPDSRSSAFAAPMNGSRRQGVGARRASSSTAQALKFKQDGAALCQQHRSGDLAMDECGKIKDGAQGRGRISALVRKRTHLVREKRRPSDPPPRSSRPAGTSSGSARARSSAARRLGHVRPRRAGLQQDGPLDGWSATHRRLRGPHADRQPRSGLQGDPAGVADRAPRVPVRGSADAGGGCLRQQGLDPASRRDQDDA